MQGRHSHLNGVHMVILNSFWLTIPTLLPNFSWNLSVTFPHCITSANLLSWTSLYDARGCQPDNSIASYWCHPGSLRVFFVLKLEWLYTGLFGTVCHTLMRNKHGAGLGRQEPVWLKRPDFKKWGRAGAVSDASKWTFFPFCSVEKGSFGDIWHCSCSS